MTDFDQLLRFVSSDFLNAKSYLRSFLYCFLLITAFEDDKKVDTIKTAKKKDEIFNCKRN